MDFVVIRVRLHFLRREKSPSGRKPYCSISPPILSFPGNFTCTRFAAAHLHEVRWGSCRLLQVVLCGSRTDNNWMSPYNTIVELNTKVKGILPTLCYFTAEEILRPKCGQWHCIQACYLYNKAQLDFQGSVRHLMQSNINAMDHLYVIKPGPNSPLLWEYIHVDLNWVTVWSKGIRVVRGPWIWSTFLQHRLPRQVRKYRLPDYY